LYRKAANNSTTGQANPFAYTPIEETDISKSTNRFTSGTNTTYNEAGMVVGDNKFRNMNFAYDANGRQVKATKANVADAWSVYDALGNRVATKVNDVWQFVIYDAFGKLVAEYGTQGEGVGGVSYVLQDWQGSVRASVNNNGFVQARFDFTAFGEEVSLGIGLRSLEQGYTGDATTKQGYGLTEKDSSGQNHTWFRKQEQKAGRWTSPDPYTGSMSLGNPQSFNRYSYVGSDALNLVDPSGLLAEGEVCDYRGIDPRTGYPIYLGTIVNGRCQSNSGPSPQIYGDYFLAWLNRENHRLNNLNNNNNSNSTGGGGSIQGPTYIPKNLPPRELPGKPYVEVPPKQPIDKINPNRPENLKVPAGRAAKVRLAIALVLRALSKLIQGVTLPIMVDPRVICEEAFKQGNSLANSQFCARYLIL
jgi:RHS repeat-associated protein